MDDNRTVFRMDVPKNFPEQLEKLSKLNKDCFDGLFDLGMKEVLEQFGVKDEKEIPEDKWQDFIMAVHNNRYIELNHQIFFLVDCGMSMFGKYTTGSRYGDLFCKGETG